MSITKPARRFIAEGRELRDYDQAFWGAYWAFPGMIPAWVTDQADNLPLVFEHRQDAALAAKVALANALLRRLTDTDKPERYQFMAAAAFAADLREAGLTPTAFARLYGTTQETVVTDWIGGLKPIPHPARVLLSLFLRHPETIDMAEEVTAASTTPRHSSLNVVEAPS